MKYTLGKYIWFFMLLMGCSQWGLAEVAQTHQEQKKAFEAAVDSGDVTTMNQFIEQHRYTGWEVKAIWYRDQFAVEEAKKNGSVGALNQFIEQYPNSSWINHAVHFRDKKAYQEAKMLNTESAYENFLKKYPNSKWREKVESRKRALRGETPKAGLKAVRVKSKKIQVVESGSEEELTMEEQRNQKALEIYQEMNQKKEDERKAREKEKQKQLKLKRKCMRMKDKLRRYNEGRRWYKLDDQGERSYMTDKEIDASKAVHEAKFKQQCKDVL